MNRLLSRLGIGAATVETRLPDAPLTPGETVEATVEMTGGGADQAIEAISFVLLTREARSERVIGQFRLTEPFTLAAGDERTVSTAVTVPPWTPVTRGDRRVWLRTGLDVAWAVDPDDEKDVEVEPGPYLEALLDALDALGFAVRDTELRAPAWLDDRPFAQTLTFEPTGEAYRDDVDALTVVSVPHEDSLRTVIEIDEREPVEAMAEVTAAVSYDSQEVFHTVDTTDPTMVRRGLERTIDQHTHTE